LPCISVREVHESKPKTYSTPGHIEEPKAVDYSGADSEKVCKAHLASFCTDRERKRGTAKAILHLVTQALPQYRILLQLAERGFPKDAGLLENLREQCKENVYRYRKECWDRKEIIFTMGVLARKVYCIFIFCI
jgi:hypothetical protein